MKRLILMRAIAQLIDLIVCLAIFVFVMAQLPKYLTHFGDVFSAVISMAAAFALMLGIEYPFMRDGQTIGKAMCGLVVVSTDGTPVTVAGLLRRELLLKLATLYFICMPMFAGQQGGQDEAAHTQVIRKPRIAK